MTTATDTPVRHGGHAAAGAPSGRRLVAAMAAVVVSGVALRLWVASAGWFYWDDLVLHALAAGHRAPDADLLLHDHDGHLMPGGMALAWLAAHAAPLDFRAPLVEMAVLDLLAGAALARLLWVLTLGRPVALVPLVAAAVVPLGVPSGTWWAAALTALPLAAATAWAAGSAVLLVREGRRRHAVGVVAATAVGLVFVEKALLVPVVTALVLAGWWWVRDPDDRPPLREVWRAVRPAVAGCAVVVAGWAAVYASTVGGPRSEPPPDAPAEAGAGVAALVRHTYELAVVPALAGGPWSWDRWQPGPPWASPGPVAVTAGVVVCLLLLGASLLTRRRTGAIWLVTALYPLVSVVAVVLVRSGPGTAAEIVQTLRYHHDYVVVLAAAGALALVAPRRVTPVLAATVEPVDGESPAGSAGHPARARQGVEGPLSRWVAVAGLVCLAASSLLSTAAYRDRWADQPSRDYLEPLVAELRARGGPVLDQDVPLEALLPVVGPAHRLSGLLVGVPGVPPVGEWTRDPVLVDAHGALHPAVVAWGRTMTPGPEPGCGWRVPPSGQRIALDGPLMGRDWIVTLHTFAGAGGSVSVRLDSGDPVEVPLDPGLATVYVRVIGSGEGVTIGPGPGEDSVPPDLCVGSGPVGVFAPA